MIKSYENQIAVVTGAANGIGRALALGIAERGSNLLLADIHGDEVEEVAKLARKMGRTAYSLQADVSLAADCEKIFRTCMEKYGRCDILVNNAGVSVGAGVETIRERDMRWIYETNVYSHWFMMQQFIPQMKKQGTHAQILNVCSIAGLITLGSAPAYFSSKHAAVGLSECVYKSLRATGADIDLAIFCPGFVQTEMHLTDRHRPERYAIDPEDPYYKSDAYLAFIEINRKILAAGKPLQETVDKVFESLKTRNFFILTDEAYDPLLAHQGEFQVKREQPIDPSLFAKKS